MTTIYLRINLLIGFLSLVFLLGCSPTKKHVLVPENYRHYITWFNELDNELYPQHIPNDSAWDFLKGNIPLLDCPDTIIEQTYYYRWWTYRKHIRQTDDGFVLTEFLPEMGHAGEHNTIACALGHHIREGRWLQNRKIIEDYINFWYHGGGESKPSDHLFHYSNWLNHAVWEHYLLTGRKDFILRKLPAMIQTFERWEKNHSTEENLFWSYDVRDGMEESISGSRTEKNRRATISSYMYGQAMAISNTARLAGKQELAKEYENKADTIKKAINERLWDPYEKFYKVMFEDRSLSGARELHGYVPWYFNIPPEKRSPAWKQLLDPEGFYAPYGPTTAEQRHHEFSLKRAYESHKACRWDGPGWPYATSQTLTSMANLLNHYDQQIIDNYDYFRQLKIYSKSHKLETDTGTVPWIDESLNPYTGEWITRYRFEENNYNGWGTGGERGKPERGKAYNHSTYCDLIINGLIGVKPEKGEVVTVNPLIPEGTWDWFCLDRVPYHGGELTILWDKTGKRYGQGRGFRIYFDGREIYSASQIASVRIELPQNNE